MQRLILHIDFDSFFASVEQQDNPLYRNRPIGVTATHGRTCIIAASREAKKMGVKSPSRTVEAKKICPAIIFVPAHFVRYWEISKKFIKICDEFSPTVEIFSIDEVFMDVTLTAKLFGGVEGLIQKLKQRLREEIGEYITASVGISHNKLLAKLASGINKPNGIFQITHENLSTVYRSAKLTDICGIGFRIEKRLNNLGIYNLLQLQKASLSALSAEFGQVEGEFLHKVGLGFDDTQVLPYAQSPEVKSVGRQYCLPQNEYDQRRVLQNIYELCEEIAIKLRRLNKKARTVGIYLGGNKNVYGRQTVTRYLNTGKAIFEICQSVLSQDSLLVIPTYVRRIGISVSNLVNKNAVPAPLFLREQKEEKINQIIDKVNAKFGDHTIRNGFLLYADK
ncbi:MAG TPA: DNA polymerase IV, partial [Patescibacteria group bacterium]